MNALMMAISGTLRPLSGIVPIGSRATAQTLVFSTGQLSGSATFSLPAGCATGDVVTITCLATGFAGFAWGQPAGSTVAMPATALNSYPIVVYVYTLTASDVTAGTLSVPCTIKTSGSWSIPVVGVVDADRGVSAQNLDVVGTLATGPLAIGDNTATATGITTTRDRDLLRYCLFTTTTPNSTSVTAPGGYTAGDAPPTTDTNNGFATTGYIQQPVAGATGAVSATVHNGFVNQGDSWGMVLLSLRKKASAITLSGTLPAPTVGTAYSGSVTATLVDGATGTLTITVDQLPAGLSLGSTTDNGDGTFTAQVTGTPTTQQTITSTFNATGGSVNATPLAHQFVVGAAQTVDDFSIAGTINNYTITEQGSPTGTGAVSGGNLVLTPAANAVDSVAARRAGTWKGVKVHASLAKLTSGGTPKYFDITLGGGAVVAVAGGSAWWHTTLANGYEIGWQNGARVFWLAKMASGSVTTVATYDTNFADNGTGYHDYELRYNSATQNIEAVLDGAVVMTYNDPSFAGGDALIAQGAYTNGDGCIASISTVTLT